MEITNEFHSDSEGFLGATDSAVPCAQMLNLAHAMDRDLKEDKNRASHLSVAILTIFESMKYSQQQVFFHQHVQGDTTYPVVP